MNMQDAFLTCLKKYADFSGRASRSEYWWFALAQMLVVIAASIVSDTLGTLVMLGLLVPMVAAATRRLHDAGRSGWWQLLTLIPLIGALVCCTGWCSPAYREPTSSVRSQPEARTGHGAGCGPKVWQTSQAQTRLRPAALAA